MVEQGRVDIATEVSLLLSFLAYPCEGHLETALHIMGYLKNKHNTQLVFDPTYPDIDKKDFPQYSMVMPKNYCPLICHHRLEKTLT